MSSREKATGTSCIDSWFSLFKKFSELIGCLAFDSDINLSHRIHYHNIDTDSSLESLISSGTYVS